MLRFYPHTLEKEIELPEMLGGVPGCSFQKFMGCLRAIIGIDDPPATFRTSQPIRQAPPNVLPVKGNGRAIRNRGRSHLLQPLLWKVALLRCLSISEAEPKDMIAQIPHCSGAVRRDHPQMLIGNLTDGALSGLQDPVQTFSELSRGETFGLGIFDANEMSQPARIPSVKRSVAPDHGGDGPDSMAIKILQRPRVRFYIHRFELDFP